MTAARKPNFLFIITDQHRADHLGCYGHPVVNTPNIDSIANNGRCFDKFFVSCAICQPNRSTLMTGRMPSLHGVRHNGVPLDKRFNTFVDLMGVQGYETALIGKSHLMNMTPHEPRYGKPQRDTKKMPLPSGFEQAFAVDHENPIYDQEHPKNWDEKSTFKLDLPFYGFKHVDLQTNHADAVGGDYVRWLEERHTDSKNLKGEKNSLKHTYSASQAWRTAVPEELYPTNYITEKSIEYLERYAQRREDEPFFLMMSYPDPHHPFTPPGKYWDMYSPADMPLPESFYTNMAPPPNVAWAHQKREDGTQVTTSQNLFAAASEEEIREIMALTCGMITMIDDSIGKVIKKLELLGLAEDTVIIFTSDHGDLLGDHQLVLKGPIHYNGLIRVPFIWSDTHNQLKLGRTDALASTLDIAQTILDRANLEPYYGIQGRSLLPEINGAEDQGPGCVLIEQEDQREYFGLIPPIRLRTLVTDQYRMTIYHGNDWGEIYDLKNDPGEMNNLWDDQSFDAIKSELLEKLSRQQMALTDYCPLPTKMA
ncbi:MAG: sulfatase-like hydrolase/transferase [Pseudomonadota bacterium]|nr:sulfatase-like hydrolase/transferase [Pseudomonadota bacterium]